MPIDLVPVSSDGSQPLATITDLLAIPAMRGFSNTVFATGILSAVEASAKLWLRRTFALTDLVEKYDGDGSNSVILKQFPVVSLTSIQIIDTSNQSVSLDLGDLDVELETGLIRFLGRQPSGSSGYYRFPTGVSNLIVTYTAGYSTIPAAVTQGIAIWAAEVCLRSRRDPSFIREKLKNYEYERLRNKYSVEPPPAALVLLSEYRDYRV